GKSFDLLIGSPIEAHVALIVGRPTMTAAGVRLELTVPTGSKESMSRGSLLGSKDIIRTLPQLQVCLLAANPQLLPERTGSDRQKTMFLRSMAAELYEAGIPCVITIPPMSQSIASRVAAQLTSTLADSTPEDLVKRFVYAIRQARKLIVESSDLRMED